MHFPETSIENLRGFGYTEDEARFLYLVATHSGYFSTRQYLAFTGAKSGDKSMAFTQKVLGKGHATARLLLRNGRVYHLFSRLVYHAIGRENLRNRREHSVEHIRAKLAVLDFVSAHLDYRYLETETDKVDYFCRNSLSLELSFPPSGTKERSVKRPQTVISLTNSRCSLLLSLPLLPLWSASVLSILGCSVWPVSRRIYSHITACFRQCRR